jgi:hypothetical protein
LLKVGHQYAKWASGFFGYGFTCPFKVLYFIRLIYAMKQWIGAAKGFFPYPLMLIWGGKQKCPLLLG